MSDARLVVLVNPRAGRGRGARYLPELLAAIAARGYRAEVVTGPDGPGAAARVRRLLGEGAAAGVIVVGGDGALNLAINAVLAVRPEVPIGLVPTGTGNDLARTLGIPRRDLGAAAALALAALDAPPHRLDLGRVDSLNSDGAGDAPRWFVNVASAGIDAAVNARANTMTRPRGAARYVLALAAQLRTFRGFAVRYVVDGQERGEAGTLVAVANSRSIGGGMLIAPDARLDDGWLDVVAAPTISRRRLAAIFPRVYRGTHVTHRLVQNFRARSVDLLPDDRPAAGGTAARELRAPAPVLHADGEPIAALPLRVSVDPGALRFLYRPPRV